MCSNHVTEWGQLLQVLQGCGLHQLLIRAGIPAFSFTSCEHFHLLNMRPIQTPAHERFNWSMALLRCQFVAFSVAASHCFGSNLSMCCPLCHATAGGTKTRLGCCTTGTQCMTTTLVQCSWTGEVMHS